MYFARQAGLLAAGHAARVEYDTALGFLEAAAHVQVTYGAVMLSFLGALHWGMEFSGYGGQQGAPTKTSAADSNTADTVAHVKVIAVSPLVLRRLSSLGQRSR